MISQYLFFQFPPAGGTQEEKSRRKAWIESMRRHMNDENWQLTRNLFVCKKHFPNGDSINGIPDFGAPITEEPSSTTKDSANESEQHHKITSTHIPISTDDNDPSSHHIEVEEIEVDASDWLPKEVSHQFKEQFIGNDPRYVAIMKDNIIMQVPNQEVKSDSQEKMIYIDPITNKPHTGNIVVVPDGKENTMMKQNLNMDSKKFIETETGEMYEILSVEEPTEQLV